MPIGKLVKYEGNYNTFVWRYPQEDFNSWTQVIVNDNQEAVFVKDGRIYDVLGAGRYKLDSDNIPLLTNALNMVTGISTVHCVIYFINENVQMSLKWGTDSKIRLIEPTANIPVEIGLSGEMNLKVSDPIKLLVNLVGTSKGITWDKDGNRYSQYIREAFRPLILSIIKSKLPTIIKENNIDIVDIDRHLEEFSTALRLPIEKGFLEYGLSIPQFYVTNVVLPEDDPDFIEFKKLHNIGLEKKKVEAAAEVSIDSAKKQARIVEAEREAELEKQTTETEIIKRQNERDLLKAQAEAEAQKIKGLAEADVLKAKELNGKDVLNADVQKSYAESLGKNGNGNSSIANDVVNIGAGIAIAKEAGKQIKDTLETSSLSNNENIKFIKCPKCGARLPESAKFCMECGTKIISKCPNCGAIIPPGGKFCLECGKKLYE